MRNEFRTQTHPRAWIWASPRVVEIKTSSVNMNYLKLPGPDNGTTCTSTQEVDMRESVIQSYPQSIQRISNSRLGCISFSQ